VRFSNSIWRFVEDCLHLHPWCFHVPEQALKLLHYQRGFLIHHIIVPDVSMRGITDGCYKNDAVRTRMFESCPLYDDLKSLPGGFLPISNSEEFELSCSSCSLSSQVTPYAKHLQCSQRYRRRFRPDQDKENLSGVELNDSFVRFVIFSSSSYVSRLDVHS
jgi:hypothetical protein